MRPGAQRMLAQAVEAEVEQYIREHSLSLDSNGHRLVVRNGNMPARLLQTGASALEVTHPRVDDRRDGMRFESSTLPPYVRKVPSLENLIPLLYLKGVSTNDMSDVLEPVLGAGSRKAGRRSSPNGTSGSFPPSATSTSGPAESTSRLA